MLAFAHIFAGTVMGYVLARYTRDGFAIPVCIAAAVLPDLIDKTLGYILLPGVIDSGRTFFHALIMAGFIAGAGFILWRSGRGRTWLLPISAGILLHQVLDTMWMEPATWFYPSLGPFRPYLYADYFNRFFWLEISSASEWLFLAASLMLLGFIYLDRPENRLLPGINLLLRPLYNPVLLLLGILGSYSFFCGVTGYPNVLAPTNSVEGDALMGILALAGIIALVMAHDGSARDNPKIWGNIP